MYKKRQWVTKKNHHDNVDVHKCVLKVKFIFDRKWNHGYLFLWFITGCVIAWKKIDTP